jgi:hypothetical protein
MGPVKNVFFSTLVVAAFLCPGFASNIAWHGFAQVNYAARITGTELPEGKGDFLLGEERVQLTLSGSSPSGEGSFFVKSDFFQDAVDDEAQLDVREAYLDLGGERAESRFGRQILTWGTGDLLFINDVFPKDWAALFSGRPLEYLKVGSDALKFNFYFEKMTIEGVVIRFFEADNLPAPDRFFLFDPFAQVTQRTTEEPDKGVDDTEAAARISYPLGRFDTALYAYRGFYRTPIAVPDRSIAPTRLSLHFPHLAVYGASLQGSGLSGVVSLEGGYYDSRQDQAGSDPLVPNSEARYLLGYQRQLLRDFTAGVQYYGEYMMRHNRYRSNLPSGFPEKDELRQLLTLRLTRFLKYQTWKLSLFGYWSPTDDDFYLIPEVRHAFSDNIWAAVGANVFGGADKRTFFGQFDKNDNLYLTLRYEF